MGAVHTQRKELVQVQSLEGHFNEERLGWNVYNLLTRLCLRSNKYDLNQTKAVQISFRRQWSNLSVVNNVQCKEMRESKSSHHPKQREGH